MAVKREDIRQSDGWSAPPSGSTSQGPGGHGHGSWILTAQAEPARRHAELARCSALSSGIGICHQGASHFFTVTRRTWGLPPVAIYSNTIIARA